MNLASVEHAIKVKWEQGLSRKASMRWFAIDEWGTLRLICALEVGTSIGLRIRIGLFIFVIKQEE
jgi:hypothetical protein